MTFKARFTLIDRARAHHLADFAREVEAGLKAQPKRLPCRFFYDRQGSLLFERICQLPEYYLTRVERGILEQRAAELAEHFSGPAGPSPSRSGEMTVVELGSGSAVKTRILLSAFLRLYGRLCYVPVDISHDMLEESSQSLLDEFPTLEVRAIAGEYQDGLRQLREGDHRRKLILWLGSNVGNLDRTEAAAFLGRVRETMSRQDRLLVGIDLRKDRVTLEKAYDDSQGVTAEFNRNILARINRELGGNFDLGAFQHQAIYDEQVGRIEMYLVSTKPQQVRFEHLDLEAGFVAGEAIHTENSYKYSLAEIAALASASGTQVERQWLDSEQRFSVNLLVPCS